MVTHEHESVAILINIILNESEFKLLACKLGEFLTSVGCSMNVNQ